MRILVVLALVASFVFANITNFVGLGYDDLNIKSDQACPVKGVVLVKNKDFIGVVQYSDGTYEVASSPKYTFQTSFVAIKEGKTVQDIFLTDYKTKKLINAKDAYYVFGSTLMSVGGDDIIPFASESDANEFFTKNKGKKIFRIDRMNENFINYLDMR